MKIKNPQIFIVGAGFFGSVIAERISTVLDLPCTLFERRSHIGGNCYSELDPHTGIEFHKYGTHIFHTSNRIVWEYISQFTEFNGYFHQVLTTHQDKVYQMPINLETINSFYNTNIRPFEVEDFLKNEIAIEPYPSPENFEEKAISMIGRPLYEAFIKGYTIKQWQKDPKLLPASILTRLPFRDNYDESYFHDKWQGIPEGGYTSIFERMLNSNNITVQLNTDFFEVKSQIPKNSIIIYSGPIDRFFEYKFGHLEWRTIEFKKIHHDVKDYQGTSVMNYADLAIPYTRIHEPRHLHPERAYPKDKTVIFEEYSLLDDGTEPYYPINDFKNLELLNKYKLKAKQLTNVFFSGRLGEYKYLDMHQTIENALNLFENTIKPLFTDHKVES